MPAIKFQLKSGEELSYQESFITDSEYLIKTNVSRNGDTEGPWAWIHPSDKEEYEKNTSGKTILVISANQCLNGIPWGAYYPVTLSGSQRPSCDMDELMNLGIAPIFDVPLVEKSAQETLEGEVTEESVEFYTYALGEEHEIVLKLKDKLTSNN